MADFTHDELIAYVLGEAPPESVSAIRAQAASDSELAATLELLGRCGGLTVSPSTHISPPRRQTAGLRRLALATAILLAVGGLSWAGWTLLAEKPLLVDHFDSNWGDIRKWRTPRRSVLVENGHLRLFDRGYLVTLDEYIAPIDLSFRWRWTDLVGDFLYRDELTVALRTSGLPSQVWPWEISDGILVKLSAHGGKVTIYASGGDFFVSTKDGSLPFPAEEWHDVRITDDGDTIAVYVTGPALVADAGRKPHATAKIPRDFPHHHIAFYNRERLASASHESWIDDVVVRRLAGAGRR